MTDLLIIGGSDAGISAALRAKEIDPNIQPTVVVADRYPNYSLCGLPFFLSGKVRGWRALALRSQQNIERRGINLLLNYQVTAIHPQERFISIEDSLARPLQLNYDKLIVATGAYAAAPLIEGLDQQGVFMLRSINDGLAINTYVDSHKPKQVMMIGAGFTGLEVADAMAKRGLQVTVVEAAEGILPTLDPDFGALVRKEAENRGIRIHTNIQVHTIERQGAALLVKNNAGFKETTGMVLVATGSRPETRIAASCGIQTGLQGAIRVNRKMETNLPDILAAGDCTETWHCLLATHTYLPWGTTAHKQGRVAGENAAGGNGEYIGSLGTQVMKAIGLVTACTGLNAREASAAGFDALNADCEAWGHQPYCPGASRVQIRITGDQKSHHLLGAQIIGAGSAQIAKHIDVLATAIYNEMTVDELNELDLGYTPPLSTPWDPIQITAQRWLHKCHRQQTIKGN